MKKIENVSFGRIKDFQRLNQKQLTYTFMKKFYTVLLLVDWMFIYICSVNTVKHKK